MRPTPVMEAIEAAVEKRRPPRFRGSRGGRARRLLVLLTLAACGCAMRRPVTLDDFRSSARAIEVLEGGPFSEQKRYILADDQFVAEVREPHNVGGGVYRFAVTHLVEKTLEPDVAAETWRRIEKLGILSWRRSYTLADAGSGSADGPDWSVDLREGDTSSESGGSSAYPGRSDPAVTVGAGGGTNSFEALKAILEPLGR